MRLLSLLLWWGGTSLLAMVLCRMFLARQLQRFPFFSTYLGAVLGSSLVLLLLQPSSSRAYLVGYWVAEVITALLSFGITWEVYTGALAPYPGIRKMARTLLGILLAIVGARAGVGLWANPHNITSAVAELESDLRVLQALLLLALAGLVVHYALPLGRNVLFLAVGYGIYVGCKVVTVNQLLQEGLFLRPWVSLLSQFSWNLATLIWCVGMWSYSSTPQPVECLECDYERTSQQTIRALGQLRDYMVHCWRSS
jgi:hypothetical protein